MKKSNRIPALIILAGAIALLQACQKDEGFWSDSGLKTFGEQNGKNQNSWERTFYSSTQQLGEGRVQAWIKENKDGEPTSVGISISEGALTNLPDQMTGIVLSLPKNKGKNFYTHVMLDWNPQGHEPPQIYGLPHFDVHFYIVSNEERLAMLPQNIDKFENLPAPAYVPAGYVRGPGFVPQMGVHWINLASPEWSGSMFTKTFIWGSYDGEFVFWEPMFTLNYLLTQPDDVVDLTQPGLFSRNGYYPAKYEISWSPFAREYTIALLDLQYHNGE